MVDPDQQTVLFEHVLHGTQTSVSYELLAGADGAFSQVRQALEKKGSTQTEIDKLSHGYKEISFPAGPQHSFHMEKNALHIWPREQFMLIALPNTDGSFTGTLFLPFSGAHSFETIRTPKDLHTFFEQFFPDALALTDDLEKEYFSAEASFLATVHTSSWVYKNLFVIGDAAHAIVPFYGQGMNAGFEDVRILDQLLGQYQDDWTKILPAFQNVRKVNADAIATLAMQNFIEMRDLVADEQFVLRKKIEAAIHQRYKNYLPLYSMVTFSDIPYSEALAKGKAYDLLMAEILGIPGIKDRWGDPEDGWAEIEKILTAHKIVS